MRSSGGTGGGLSGMLGGLSGLFGNSGNVDNSNANIGWVPLAPGEQYQPWYGQNNSYPTTSLSTASNNGNLYNYYRNMQYSRAATMIPVSAWRSGNFKSPSERTNAAVESSRVHPRRHSDRSDYGESALFLSSEGRASHRTLANVRRSAPRG